MSSLAYLLNSIPHWVGVLSSSGSELRICARPPHPSGRLGRSYILEVRSGADDHLCVAEVADRRQLPATCVERHINPDSTFCLFINSSEPISSTDQAEYWWESLRIYLVNQDFAHKRGSWPIESGLSHGDAGRVQLEMEEIAEPLNWKEELLNSMFRGEGWLSGSLPRRHRRKGALVAARSPCPRGCTRKHAALRKRACELVSCSADCRRQHKSILRAECPNRDAVERLVLLEYERRAKEAELIAALKADGIRCCGTMKNCPLRRS